MNRYSLQKLAFFLNPIVRLGFRKYSIIFPLLVNISLCVVSELYCYGIAKNPHIVGTYIIFSNVALLIYFSFRDGIKGGVISTFVAVAYYFYIIFTRQYKGNQLYASIEVTILLAAVYFFLALIIGWLKQRIDTLIVQEKLARHAAEVGQIRLKTILEQLPVGVLLADVHTNSIEGNRQLEKILGTKIGNTLNNDDRNTSQYAYSSNKLLTFQDWPITRALQNGEIVNAEEIEFIKGDKKRLFLRVNASPIRNRNRSIIAAVSTIYDITQEKELELRKDDFINMASHELKTPLTSMKLYIDLLINRLNLSDDEKALKTVKSIRTQTEKLQGIVSDLLDVSRIQTGKLHLNKEIFDISMIIKETIELLQETTKKHKIIFTTNTPVSVYADRFRIYQVLTNLVTNAIKYSPEGKKIIIKVTQKDQKAIISVQDFGIGIEEGQRSKIFEKLYQVTDATAKTFPGLGMGLYISKEIIRRHKGTIWAEGEKGKGSTFYFTLPVHTQ